MATFAQKDHQFLLVGKSLAASGTKAATLGALVDGEIGVFNPGGVLLTEAAAATADRFVIAVGRGANLPPLVSSFINKADIKKSTRKLLVAATEQVDYIGYNTSANAIEVNNDTVYRATLNIHEPITQNHGGIYIKDLVYKSSSSATQAEIADGLISNAIANFSREAYDAIKFERVCNNAGAASTAASGTITFVKGRNTIATSGATPATDYSVGDYIRFGTAVTDIVYKVTAVSNANQTITLDIPYQGVSGTLTATNHEFITSALAASANFGIKMTGVAQPFTVGKKHYYKMRWTTTLDSSSFGATVITNSTSASEGAGTYEQVAELEWFVNGNNSEFFRMGEPNLFPLNSMVANEPYDIIDIEFEDGRTDSLGYVNSPKRVTLAIPTSTNTPFYAITSVADDITDVLEVLTFGSTTGALAV